MGKKKTDVQYLSFTLPRFKFSPLFQSLLPVQWVVECYGQYTVVSLCCYFPLTFFKMTVPLSTSCSAYLLQHHGPLPPHIMTLVFVALAAYHSLCSLLFCPSSIFCPFLNMFSHWVHTGASHLNALSHSSPFLNFAVYMQ